MRRRRKLSAEERELWSRVAATTQPARPQKSAPELEAELRSALTPEVAPKNGPRDDAKRSLKAKPQPAAAPDPGPQRLPPSQTPALPATNRGRRPCLN